MTAGERFRRARDVFLGALALEPSERPAFLAAACGDDAELRSRVQAMLAADAIDDGFLDAAPVLPLPTHKQPVPRSIAGYRVLGHIGEGAMGAVYAAMQDRPRRVVALKVLHHDAPESLRRRFEHEAEILARLEHPEIARVLEAGAERADGATLCYMALEWVPGGRPITEYVREADTPHRERLELIATVADAIAHAHQRGVIHRDLKPANVLVDEAGRPRVIDFGVARLNDPDLSLTLCGPGGAAVIGTPAYMSPEQCQGRPDHIDARADIYALGAILYELLVQRPPHDVAHLPLGEALNALAAADPPSPAAADPSLKGDLDAIVLKAMACSPHDRYQSASEFAADIRRHLAHEPILARPPSHWQRALRRLGRHPLAATAAACALLAAVSLGSTLAGIQYLAYRPDRVELIDGDRRVALLSRAGHRIHTWDSGVPGGVVEAAMLASSDAPASRLVLIAYSHRALTPSFAGHLVAYDVGRPRRVVWSTRDAPPQFPPPTAPHPEAALNIEGFFIADIIDASPGAEIVLRHGMYPYSPMAIRVFDARGRQRYQTIHNGVVNELAWLPESRRLVGAGLGCAGRWDQRGVADALLVYQNVLFAVEPVDGHIAERTWNLRDDRPADPTLHWYLWLGPPEILSALAVDEVRVRPGPEQEGLRRAIYEVDASPPETGWAGPASLCFVLDPLTGDVLGSSPNDVYKQAVARGEVPHADAVRLFDLSSLPPITRPHVARSDAPRARDDQR